MTAAVGLSRSQAERLKHRADKLTAKIEDATAELRRLIPDCNVEQFTVQMDTEHCLEEFRNVARGIQETVDRRTA